MRLSTGEVARLLLVLTLLLSAAHGFGYLFARFRQPRVIGEILGGLLLGPTLFGALFPGLHAAIFPAGGAVAFVLDGMYQLGLLLLMFSAGTEIRSSFHRGEKRTVLLVTVAGTVFPFLAGVLFLSFLDPRDYMGTAGTETAFLLVFGIAVAVTSIPVISRILFDLGILSTAFARIVLAVAVIEDVLLYVLLAVALGLVVQAPGEASGLPGLLGINLTAGPNIAYHVVATLFFLGASFILGPPIYRRTLRFRFNLLKRGSPIAFQLVFMLSLTLIAVFLGVVALFGAFVAGVIAGSSTSESEVRSRESIKTFAFAFFVPVYFAIVGLRLDLIRQFDPLFFLGFFAFACLAKSLSVYAGARVSGEPGAFSGNLAIALNARGGPGIVLASVALDARIINESFYATLVMLAVLTSLAAGSWLERVVKGGKIATLSPRSDTVSGSVPKPSSPPGHIAGRFSLKRGA